MRKATETNPNHMCCTPIAHFLVYAESNLLDLHVADFCADQLNVLNEFVPTHRQI